MKKNILLTCAIFIVFIFAIVIFYIIYVYIALSEDCEFKINKKIISPNNDMVVFEFEKECGATTPFNTQVSISKTGKKNDFSNEMPFLVIRCRYNLSIKWVNDKLISIYIPNDVEIYKKRIVIRT